MSNNSQDIYHTQVRQGVALAWVNSYSAVVVKTPRATLLFDPVSMAVPPDTSLDLIAVSHGHSDHWDPPLVAALRRRTGAVVAASPNLASRLDGALPGPASRQLQGGEVLNTAAPVQPGDQLRIADLTVTALRCDHPAVEPVSFLVRSDEGVTLYLPGDTTPFPEMTQLTGSSEPQSTSCKEKDASHHGLGVDLLIWTGTAFEDGARISQLVQPKVMVTYAVDPPAAGARARDILTSYAPEVPCHSLSRHQVFVYP